MTITLRDIQSEDEAFVRQVYACTRSQEMSMVPWNDEQREAFLRFQFDAQDSHYRSQYPQASYQLILRDGEPLGRLYVDREPELIRILDITVLPEFRSAGIGTSLLRPLLAEADEKDQTVCIWVEQDNPSQRLFQRLGFRVASEDGYNQLMQYRKSMADATSPT